MRLDDEIEDGMRNDQRYPNAIHSGRCLAGEAMDRLTSGVCAAGSSCQVLQYSSFGAILLGLPPAG
jgi:hypothetical protein